MTIEAQHINEEAREVRLSEALGVVCEALEAGGHVELAKLLRSKLERRVDESPIEITVDQFETSLQNLKNLTNRFQDPYSYNHKFNRWLMTALRENEEKRKVWMRGIGISEDLIDLADQLDFSGEVGGPTTILLSQIKENILDFVKLLVAFCTDAEETNDHLISDIRVVQKYLVQNKQWK